MVFVNATIGCGIFLPKTKENTDPSCFPRSLCHALTKSFGRNHFLPIDCGRVLRFMRRLYKYYVAYKHLEEIKKEREALR
jgi:hypothetical protein